MSYWTRHMACWDDNGLPEEEVARELARAADGEHLTRTPERSSGQSPEEWWLDIITGQEKAEWPEMETHMRAVSRRWPDVTFKVMGQGEDMADVWTEYFRDGLSQLVHMPEFDPEKLA